MLSAILNDQPVVESTAENPGDQVQVYGNYDSMSWSCRSPTRRKWISSVIERTNGSEETKHVKPS
jgi:hypothetical protein